MVEMPLTHPPSSILLCRCEPTGATSAVLNTSAHASPRSGGYFCPETHVTAPGRQHDEEGCSQAATEPNVLWASTSPAPLPLRWYRQGLRAQGDAPNAGLRPRQKAAFK